MTKRISSSNPAGRPRRNRRTSLSRKTPSFRMEPSRRDAIRDERPWRLNAPAQRLLDFRTWPNLPQGAGSTFALHVGRYGEAYLQLLLLSWGFEPIEATPGASWDIGLVIPALTRDAPRLPRFVRIQVKASVTDHNGGGKFQMRKGYRGSPGGVTEYDSDEFDLTAMISGCHDFVFFTAARGRSFRVAAGEVPALRLSAREDFLDALQEIGALTAYERELLRRPCS